MTFSADTLARQLAEAITLWHTVTGVDPDGRSFRLGDLDVVQANRELVEAQKLDPTPITAYLMLASFADDYFARRKFSVNELLGGSQQTLDYLDACRRLKAILASPEIQSIGSAFATVLRQAVRHYDAASAAVEKLIGQQDEIAFLRRDALRSMEQLRVDQFLRGQAENATPVYHKSIFQWWNINSLLAGTTALPSGVSIHLIRDADAYQSYFCFCVRNGGNLFLLSDAPAHSHPLQGQMSRRPDRQLGRRIARNWFPYHLMDLEDNEDGGVYVPRQEGLVAYQSEAVRLREIRELEPPEILWIAMMFDQIVDQFWRAGYQAPQLSYTAEMIRVASPLLDAARSACLPITHYDPLVLPPLTPEDMRDNPEVKAQLGSPGGKHNAWMEERYGPQVDPSVLNLIGSRKGDHYLTAGNSGIEEGSAPSTLPSLSRPERTAYKLEPLPPTLFGDRARLLADRSFLARYNQAKAIQKFADAEFRARKDEIVAWFEAALTANRPALLDMACDQEYWQSIGGDEDHDNEENRDRFQGYIRYDPESKRPVAYRMMYRYDDRVEKPHWSIWPMHRISQGLHQTGEYFRCVITGAKPTYTVIFRPQCPHSLALLCGVAVSDLPDVLQHWRPGASHAGNHILDRIDPLAWALQNPWHELSFLTAMDLSIRGLKRLIRDRKPPV